MSRKLLGILVISASLVAPVMASGEDLYGGGAWSALASDNTARAVGDSLTVVIYENSTASNSARLQSGRDTGVSGRIAGGSSFDEAGQASVAGSARSSGEVGRAGKLVAQLSVVVAEVLPNGDLRVAGDQTISINGEAAHIAIRGRVRRVDITSENVVLSTRLADVLIDYNGSGFVSRQAAPGPIARIFNWLGVL